MTFPALIVISVDVPDPESIPAILTHIDPPSIPHFADEIRVVPGPEDVAYIIDLMESDKSVVALLRTLAKACHNGAGDPYQEFYDEGYAPMLERMADRLEK